MYKRGPASQLSFYSAFSPPLTSNYLVVTLQFYHLANNFRALATMSQLVSSKTVTNASDGSKNPKTPATAESQSTSSAPNMREKRFESSQAVDFDALAKPPIAFKLSVSLKSLQQKSFGPVPKGEFNHTESSADMVLTS